ncbi:MAG: WYL domain-containing protein [Saccharospirillaceae bacterium]|nr:WYL domain-containing protein [Pseudomonadales bacterium]NRB81748.1 WYL domain-containing protein [Saccharospirillaceae bacterium]
MHTEKHEVTLRLRAIELIALWEGRLITNQLITWFGISRQQASSDIKRYIEQVNPESLTHDLSVRAYVPTPGFQPVLTQGNISEYMDLLARFSGHSSDVITETQSNLVSVQLPDRSVRAEVVREILASIRLKNNIKILYASMANPALCEREISAHSLVYTGFRWHLRGFCHIRQQFRDFNLSRIDRIPTKSSNNTSYIGIADDVDWNEVISIDLIPNTNLNLPQKNLIERDYMMPDGRLTLSVRKALAHYTLQRYQAAITDDEITRVNQYPIQLSVNDRKKLSVHLFGGNNAE